MSEIIFIFWSATVRTGHMQLKVGASMEDQKDHFYLKCQGLLQLVNQWNTG